jgi:hypothetical protein
VRDSRRKGEFPHTTPPLGRTLYAEYASPRLSSHMPTRATSQATKARNAATRGAVATRFFRWRGLPRLPSSIHEDIRRSGGSDVRSTVGLVF